MTTLTPQQIADLKASIAAKYQVIGPDDRTCRWWVGEIHTWEPLTENEHGSSLDAEAELEAIIQDELKAAIEEME